ncbi:MAG: hypothetical protein ACKO6N_17785 [Myxococcota bacterium]
MSASTREQDKTLKVLTRTLLEILNGESSYRDESVKLKRLGMETGPDLEDLLADLAQRWPSFVTDLPGLLHAVLSLPLPVVSALLELLVSRDAVSALVALRDEGARVDARKLVGAALQRLRMKGLTIPEPVSFQKSVPTMPLEVYASLSGLANGRTVIWFVPPRAQQPVTAYILQWSDATESLELRSTTAELSALRETALGYCKAAFPETMFQLRLGHGLALVEEWMDLMRAQHQQLPFELIWLVQDLKQLFGVTPEPYRPQGAEAFEPHPFMAMEDIQQLLSYEETFLWTPGEEVLLECLGELSRQEQEQEASRLVLSPEVQQERERERHRRMLSALYSGAWRLRLARRMEEHCDMWERRGEHTLVKRIWELALVLRTPLPVADISFMEVFFEANLGALMQLLQAELAGAGQIPTGLEMLAERGLSEQGLSGQGMAGPGGLMAPPSPGSLIVGTGRDWTPSDVASSSSRILLP